LLNNNWDIISKTLKREISNKEDPLGHPLGPYVDGQFSKQLHIFLPQYF